MITLPQEFAQEMVAQAKEEAPYEACGIIAGKEGRAVKLYRTANAEHSTTTYRLVPEEQYRIFVEMEKKGWELYGIYHSHPVSPAYPSPRDIEMAYYPETAYFIVGLYRWPRFCFGLLRGVLAPLLAKPYIRAFRIAEGEVREEELVIG
jgi:proteasome lid subunit RPN8/RPN11